MIIFPMKPALLFSTFATAFCLAVGSSPLLAENADAARAAAAARPVEPKDTGSEVATDQATDSETESLPQSILLRYQFKKGQYVHYEEDSRSEMTLMAREQTQSTRENRRTNKHFRVIAVDENGSAVVEPVIDRVQMEVRNDNDPAVTYDSARKETASKDFAKVEETIGKPSLRIRYSANGTVEQLLPLVPQNKEQQTTDDQEKQNFLIAFPEEAIAIGEAWTDNYTIDVSVDGDLTKPLKKRVTVRRTYTLKELDGDIASIHFRIFPLSVERDPQIQAQLIHHSRFGTIEFDTKRGIILEWQSSGSGHVFNAFGPSSSMKALSSTTERYVPSPSAAKRLPPSPKKPAGPAGPQLPGVAARP
ncbi:MAG: hypothetical protein ISQ06_09365 [Planctomycetaceae bacterium]|jgi:hypothetical protein|nr:hypothetical protein [Planctomycetaceae bacterium]